MSGRLSPTYPLLPAQRWTPHLCCFWKQLVQKGSSIRGVSVWLERLWLRRDKIKFKCSPGVVLLNYLQAHDSFRKGLVGC